MMKINSDAKMPLIMMAFYFTTGIGLIIFGNIIKEYFVMGCGIFWILSAIVPIIINWKWIIKIE